MPFIAIVYARDADRARELIAQHRTTLIGLYRFPSKSEEMCPGATCRAGFGWARDKSNGHLIHACGRRNRNWRKMMRGMLYDVFGRNRAANVPPSFRDPDGTNWP